MVGWYCLPHDVHATETQPARVGLVLLVELGEGAIFCYLVKFLVNLSLLQFSAGNFTTSNSLESTTWEVVLMSYVR